MTGLVAIGFRNVVRRPLRSILTSAGVAFGAASYVVLVASGQGLKDDLRTIVAGLGSEVLVQHAGASLPELSHVGPADVAALPAGSALNINTASADVITAAIPDLAGDKLAEFIADRARKPFTSMSELRERLPRGIAFPEGATFTFASSYFLVSVRSRQGDAIAQARALLRRDGRSWPAVVWTAYQRWSVAVPCVTGTTSAARSSGSAGGPGPSTRSESPPRRRTG